MLLICTNLTEVLLGYFVENGVDDIQMGNCAPLSGLYKSRVIGAAAFLGLTQHIIYQRPSEAPSIKSKSLSGVKSNRENILFSSP